MIQIDKTDFLYKTLQNLGVEDKNLEDEYISFAQSGITNAKDFNNNLQAMLGMDYLGEIDENCLEEVLDYYKDLKTSKCPPQSKLLALLKEYKKTPQESLRQDIINSQLKEVLLIACVYKMRNIEVNLSDLVQVCNMGLITAVDKFKPDSKIKFETYLNYWILQAIKEFTLGEQKNG